MPNRIPDKDTIYSKTKSKPLISCHSLSTFMGHIETKINKCCFSCNCQCVQVLSAVHLTFQRWNIHGWSLNLVIIQLQDNDYTTNTIGEHRTWMPLRHYEPVHFRYPISRAKWMQNSYHNCINTISIIIAAAGTINVDSWLTQNRNAIERIRIRIPVVEVSQAQRFLRSISSTRNIVPSVWITFPSNLSNLLVLYCCFFLTGLVRILPVEARLCQESVEVSEEQEALSDKLCCRCLKMEAAFFPGKGLLSEGDFSGLGLGNSTDLALLPTTGSVKLIDFILAGADIWFAVELSWLIQIQ